MAGKTEIDFNADYLFDKNGDNTIQREESSNKEDRVVTSTNTLRSELFAAKLVLSRPLLGGNVMIGAEYSHTERQDDYVNPEGYVPTTLIISPRFDCNSFGKTMSTSGPTTTYDKGTKHLAIMERDANTRP